MQDYRWNDLSVGMTAQFDVELTPAMMEGFAELSGDVNPLHVDKTYAEAAGFPGPVAFGMLTSSFYSQLVGVHLPGRRALLHGVNVEFKSPAFVGDRLTVSGEIAFLNDAYKRLELKARIRNQAGKIISKATVQVGLHES